MLPPWDQTELSPAVRTLQTLPLAYQILQDDNISHK